ncbi:MAG TPA: MerR family DNA-binding protein [Methylomirabilota bacterium]|nr:MerR family DNA-binding protein [Methylomirabilota bacterium]
MLTIGQVAQRVGLRPSAIRFYERRGMLRPTLRAPNGYRFYGEDVVKLLRFVKRAQSLGITLKEIKPLLALAARGQQPCSHVKQLAQKHLEEVGQKIRALRALQKDFRSLLRRRATRRHGDEVCPMVERPKSSTDDCNAFLFSFGRRRTSVPALHRQNFAGLGIVRGAESGRSRQARLSVRTSAVDRKS